MICNLEILKQLLISAVNRGIEYAIDKLLKRPIPQIFLGLNIMKVIKEFEYDKIDSWRDGNPYTICFMYTKNTSGIIKGGAKQVEKFIESDIKVPCIAHFTYFHRGATRRNVIFKNFKQNRIYFTYDWDSGLCRKENTLSVLRVNGNEIKKIRRIPRKWMKELDNLK
jgi:hypothetical protein